MAITNARMQIKRGNEVDFDAEKMLVGEWALSTDKKIVRICVAPNVCIRMATYDAFEVDMAQIDKILEECRTIEDVVKLINSQVSEKLELTIEYTNQAKQYRDEAEQFRNEAEAFAPDGYSELQETVASNTAKIDTIIEKAELNIKNSASGENLHLTDSANGKNVGFGLYGKAEQKQYSGKNLLNNTSVSNTANGVTFTVNDGSVTANGTATANAFFDVGSNFILPKGDYILSQGFNTFDGDTRIQIVKNDASSTYIAGTSAVGRSEVVFSLAETTDCIVRLRIKNGYTANNLVFKPMIRLASITDSTYEPYVGGIASPNPDYPQEITVSGSDGSVEVVSCGKNLLENNLTSKTVSDMVITRNNDGSVTLNGVSPNLSDNNAVINNDILNLPKGRYILSGCPSGGSANTYRLVINNTASNEYVLDTGNGAEFVVDDTTTWKRVYIRMNSGVTANNLTFKPMIRKADITDAEYEPYKATVSTILTDGLAGMKVSSGGNYTDENGQMWICDEVVKYADGNGKRIQRIANKVFDGVNNACGWVGTITGVTETLTQMNLNIADAFSLGVYSIICDKFNVDKTWTNENNTLAYTCRQSTSTGACCCYLKESDGVTDKNTANAWLQDNNVTVYYILKEPIITDLSAEEIAEIEKLHTFYPVTNISNDADCGMSITYMADAKNYIDNRLALIESAMLNNI